MEVLELERIPDTTSVLASYHVTLRPSRDRWSGRARHGAEPWRAYLRGRRHEQHTRDRAYGEALEAAQRIHAAAAACAAEHTRHRVQQGGTGRGLLENIANDAYLVAAETSDAFLAAVRQAEEGAELVRTEITGPWAPYSFAAAGPDETGAGSAPGDQEDTEATTG